MFSQKHGSGNKVYFLHEPQVVCISKEKEHKKYESGNKVSIIRSADGIILGTESFRNEYDGHAIGIRSLAGDRRYRGRKRHRLFCKRAGIEPTKGI